MRVLFSFCSAHWHHLLTNLFWFKFRTSVQRKHGNNLIIFFYSHKSFCLQFLWLYAKFIFKALIPTSNLENYSWYKLFILRNKNLCDKNRRSRESSLIALNNATTKKINKFRKWCEWKKLPKRKLGTGWQLSSDKNRAARPHNELPLIGHKWKLTV